ncbi:4Fe-4S dicluster domain-containing protein [Paraburkholderia acidiphila]|uniref:4Fe-4S dicluster domain-containing protein n=1 Tax=Paraburkholderia acidiphila TaxID=2571747 RepID=A0A7Z2G9C3_9BURK|nr:4Fe-4S dicluster domain-containing protein [Paraburkholderia acidiphila]QGZ57445.1 4Fe-4S dicluster domain-containing protein [Paraburkholderia acidiphila]
MTQMALVIDLNVCVGCHACVTSCKEWNTSGQAGSLSDVRPYDADPSGTFFNRVQTYEAGEFPNSDTIHFPKSCLHCEDPPCVPVCPTGASFKRKEDGLVLVDYDKCIGCKYCSWACPYGARELDEARKEMTKCTLCADRIYNEALPERDRKPACVLACPTSARIFGDIHDPESDASKAIQARGGYQLMPEWGTKPSNHYLPRVKTESSCGSGSCGCGGGASAASPTSMLEAGEPINLASLAIRRGPAMSRDKRLDDQLDSGKLNLAAFATRVKSLFTRARPVATKEI